jgi:hypothetical protein
MKSQKYRKFARARGKNFEPNIADAAMLTKYTVNRPKLFTDPLKVKLVNVNHTKVLNTRKMDGIFSFQAVFSLSTFK